MQQRRAMPVCLSIRPYTLLPVHPSIQPSIFSLAGHSYFAKQSSFLFITSSSAAPSFLSARSSSARPSFLNPSTPIGFFRGLSFECLFHLFFYSSSSPPPSSSSLPASLCCSFFPSSFHSILRRYEYEFVLPCRFVQFDALSYFWLPRGKGICERKAHDDGRKGSYRNIGLDQTFARFVAYEKRTFAIRQREKSIVRIAYYCDSLVLHNYTLIMHEETIYIPSNYITFYW